MPCSWARLPTIRGWPFEAREPHSVIRCLENAFLAKYSVCLFSAKIQTESWNSLRNLSVCAPATWLPWRGGISVSFFSKQGDRRAQHRDSRPDSSAREEDSRWLRSQHECVCSAWEVHIVSGNSAEKKEEPRVQENVRVLGKRRKGKQRGGGIRNQPGKHASGTEKTKHSEIRSQDNKQGPGDSATRTEAPERACCPGTCALTSGLPCRCGSVSICRSRTVLSSTENPSPQPARRPWAGLPRAPQRGTPGYTCLWANRSSRSCSKTTGTSKLGLREKEKPGHGTEGFTYIFLLKSPFYLLKLMASIRVCKTFTVQFKARLSAPWPRGQRWSCSFPICLWNPQTEAAEVPGHSWRVRLTVLHLGLAQSIHSANFYWAHEKSPWTQRYTAKVEKRAYKETSTAPGEVRCCGSPHGALQSCGREGVAARRRLPGGGDAQLSPKGKKWAGGA